MVSVLGLGLGLGIAFEGGLGVSEEEYNDAPPNPPTAVDVASSIPG